MDRPLDVGDLVGAFFGTLFVVLNAGLLGHVLAALVTLACGVSVVVAYLRAHRGTGEAGGCSR